MKRYGVWLFVLLLAGCGWGQPQGNSPEAICRREAYNDPTVKRVTIESMGTAGINQQMQFKYNKAIRDATNACLRRRGIKVPGGVEPVEPR
jgi:hypothetical protein